MKSSTERRYSLRVVGLHRTATCSFKNRAPSCPTVNDCRSASRSAAGSNPLLRAWASSVKARRRATSAVSGPNCPEHHAAGATVPPILDEKEPPSARHHANAEPGQLGIECDVV